MSSKALVKLKEISNCMSYTKRSHHLLVKKEKLNILRIAKESGSQLQTKVNALLSGKFKILNTHKYVEVRRHKSLTSFFDWKGSPLNLNVESWTWWTNFFHEALSSPMKEKWLEAMWEEIWIKKRVRVSRSNSGQSSTSKFGYVPNGCKYYFPQWRIRWRDLYGSTTWFCCQNSRSQSVLIHLWSQIVI